MRGEDVLQLMKHIGEETEPDIGDDYADGVGSSLREVAGDLIGNVSHFLGGLQHALLRFWIHSVRAAQRAGDSHHGEPALFGDVFDADGLFFHAPEQAFINWNATGLHSRAESCKRKWILA